MNSKSVLLFLIFLNFSQLIFGQQLTKDDCNCKIQTAKRLLGGEVSIPHAYPFHVSFSKKSTPNLSFCAGVILNHNQILTKGGCLSKEYLDIKDFIKDSIIRAGVNNLTSTEGEIFTIKKVYKDKRFINPFVVGDIAIVEVNEIIKFTKKNRPGCIATKFEHYDDKKDSLKTIGWNPIGNDKFNYNTGVLKEVSLNYNKNAIFDMKCEEYYICYEASERGHIINSDDFGSALIHESKGISRIVGIQRSTNYITHAGASRISFYKPEIDKWTGNNYCSGDI